MLLASSDPNGLCFVETASLDGETNLKVRQAAPDIVNLLGCNAADTVEHAASMVHAQIECEQPNEDLTTFNGVFTMDSGGLPSCESNLQQAVDASQMLLRGCKLRNTRWVIGLVINTGQDTKIQQNLAPPPQKMSQVEYVTNVLTIIILCVQVLVCISGGIAYGVIVASSNFNRRSYLNLGTNGAKAGTLHFFTLLSLLSNFIPISLIVTMGMVKAMQSFFISSDEDMYYHPTKSYAATRTSDLNEELGQVKYVFTDKTGTLTSNVMEFRKCCVRGQEYGAGITQVRRRVLKAEGLAIPPEVAPDPYEPRTPNVNFIDNELRAVLAGVGGDSAHQQNVNDFLVHLAVNHAVVVEEIATESNQDASRKVREIFRRNEERNVNVSLEDIAYSASSPDEGALVYGARHFDVAFVSRSAGRIRVILRGLSLDIELLVAFEFTSARRRSSVLCAIPIGNEGKKRYVLFCKGADSAIIPLLTTNGLTEDKMLAVMEEYAVDGLRTLCVAKKEMSEAEVADICADYTRCSMLLEGRAEALDQLAESVETGLELQGVTGIEDKLQDQVPETIEKLRQAGINVWMLTGDKLETAINIGIATNLITSAMRRVILTTANAPSRVGSTSSDSSNESNRSSTPSVDGSAVSTEKRQMLDFVKKSIDAELSVVDNQSQTPRVVIVDGQFLEVALMDPIKQDFIKLTRNCGAVICCRTSPQQKASVVNAVRESEKCVTLAIGDGANDIGMIQSAHAGIGLRGEEGLQAFNNSDYGLSQFKHLGTLLLVHGRWSYRRTSKLVNYMFYKNIVVVMPLIYFLSLSLVSGQTMYLEVIYQLYNVFLTAMPIIIYGVFEQDVDRKSSMSHPQLYKAGITNSYMNLFVFSQWMLGALWHSVAIFALPYLATTGNMITIPEGWPTDIWFTGQLMFFCIMMVVNLRVLSESYYYTWMLWFWLIVSILAWFIFMLMLSTIPSVSRTSLGLMFRLLATPAVYPVVAITITICLSREVVWKVVKRNFFQDYLHVVQDKMVAEITHWRFKKTSPSEVSEATFMVDDVTSTPAVDTQRLHRKSTAAWTSGFKSIGGRGFAFSPADSMASRMFLQSALTSGFQSSALTSGFQSSALTSGFQ
eukprot:Lankesteria_metandrocarpae@DN4393_c0_g1_i2.p1